VLGLSVHVFHLCEGNSSARIQHCILFLLSVSEDIYQR